MKKNKLVFSLGLSLLLLLSTCYALETVKIAPLALSIKSSTITVTTSATALPTTALKGRESISIRNKDSATTTIFIGGSDVTAANGYPLDSTTPAISIDINDSVVIYGITSSGTADARIIEAK